MPKVLVNISKRDTSNQGILRQVLGGIGVSALVTYKPMEMGDLQFLARKHNCFFIVVSNQETLTNIVPTEGNKPANIDDWRGSVLNTTTPILITLPISYVFAKPEGRWILEQDIQKINYYKAGGKPYTYSFEVIRSSSDIFNAFGQLEKAAAVTIDIETTLTNRISSISFTPISNDLQIGKSYVFSMLPKDWTKDKWEDVPKSLELLWIYVRAFLKIPSITKVFHNGCFDNFHLLRYHCPAVNWIFDTEYMWHCWESEQKKSLSYISSILLPDYYYWKHESESHPLEYNAKDTINTARVFIELLKRMPKWAWRNYALTIPNAIPIVKTQFEGFLVDRGKKERLKTEAVALRDKMQAEIEALTGINGFNPGSPKQVSFLFYKVLHAKKPGRAKSSSATGELDLKKLAQQHPIYARLVDLILKIREERKAISTYYDARLTKHDKLLFSLQLDGTETERMSCSASSLWDTFESKDKISKTHAKNLGTQAQNLPYYYKKAIKAEPGYLILEADKSQSEARCTAYLSGDKALIQALENPPEVAGVSDFYCYTGFKFFGIEFDKKHILRQAVKKIIHGTNYLMGAMTFIDSAGVSELQGYKVLVGFKGTLKSFAAYSLELYHQAYPGVQHWWDRIVDEIARTGKLVTPDGWTRKFHGNIRSNHSIKRSAVAHCSQHLSVRGVNRAFWEVFYYVEVPSKGKAYRLKCQVHDSLVGIVSQNEETQARVIEAVTHYLSRPQPTPNGDLVIPIDIEVGEYWKK